MHDSTVSPEERLATFRKCRHSLAGHPRRPLAEVLADLAAGLSDETRPDVYGTGQLIEDFEKKIARTLGKPAAVFMPSGTMAQPIALRIWSDRKRIRNVGFHATSHLELHEHKAYSVLHDLEGVVLGDRHRILTLEDLEKCALPLAASLYELPQREIGGALPAWEELTKMSNWARERDIAFHMDGARLWESQPFYGRSHAEIAALFDSVYVSFYKGLGGITGAVLAGDQKLIAEAKIWQRRQGGNLYTLFPYVLSADRAFDSRLARMGAYRDKALEVAEILRDFPEVTITPDPPHTNMMHAHFRAPLAQLERASFEIARDLDLALFYRFEPTAVPGTFSAEISMGDSSLELPREKLREGLEQFILRIRR